jgi:ATP-dependent exoDNAse (exonuclease V) beta subunit
MVSYRDEVSLSPAQREVLFDPASHTLVAAGAGSGKTRLLVAYFVHALLDLGLELEDLAAVTFTRKAGSELAEKIRQELIRCDRPDLARRIDSAAIGTIHGLCRRLLAAESLAAGVDPSFGVLEADTESLVREEVFAKAWSRAVEEATEDELRVLASREGTMSELVLSLYDRLRGMGQAVPRVIIAGSPSAPGAREELIGLCDEALRQGYQTAKIGPDLQKSLGRITACRQWLERVATVAEADLRVGDTSGFFPSMVTRSAKSYLEPVRDSLIRYRQALAEHELKRLVDVVNKLLSVFHEQYEAYKESRGVLDFSDLELRAGAMLRGGAAGPVSGGPVLASHVLVDEFQDTNEVQCAIINGLRPERLLMVGDARQSIYSFRGADVEVFLARVRDEGINQFRLDTNYRSRPEVLTFVNHLFSRPSFFEDRFSPLLAGRKFGAGDGSDDPRGEVGPTEILVVERTAAEGEEDELAKQQAEAYVVADRIRRLVDEQGWHRSDIVVLLPQLTEVNQYQDALFARGLDVYVVRGKGYYSQDEVADVSALLRLLLNPNDDLALLTVLRSPLAAVSDDCLYLLGRASRARRSRSLWQVIRDGSAADRIEAADRERLQALLDRLERVRERVGRPGLSRLIDEVLTACDYDLCLLAAPHGKRRFANVRKLMRMAADFEDLEGPDLKGFVTLIESLGDMGDDEGNAPSLAEGEDVVRVMTVHQAKGLEFPVVVLAGLCSDARGYRAPEIMVGGDGRMAARVKVPSSSPDHPSWGPADAIIEEQQRRKAEEDVRLLYVAMTRARDLLILVGSRKAEDKLEGSRIGRIVAALGQDPPPAPGVSVPLDDIHALAMGVAPVPVADDESASPGTSVAGEIRVAAPPCLLDLAVHGIATRQVSFSALAAYDRCPRRFYLERVLGLGATLPLSVAHPSTDPEAAEPGVMSPEEARLDDVESQSGVNAGILVHALLEGLDLAGGRPAGADLRVQAAGIAAEKGLKVPEEVIERAAALAAAFWEHPLAGTPEAGRALREAPFFFVQDGIAVGGVMDLLIQDGHRWLVADYKSNALRGRSPAEVAEGYRLQAAMYCLAALKAGAPAVRMEFVFLERPDEPVAFEYRPEDLPALHERLEGALAGIKNDDFHPRTGPSCAKCSRKDVCDAMNSRRLVVE